MEQPSKPSRRLTILDKLTEVADYLFHAGLVTAFFFYFLIKGEKQDTEALQCLDDKPHECCLHAHPSSDTPQVVQISQGSKKDHLLSGQKTSTSPRNSNVVSGDNSTSALPDVTAVICESNSKETLHDAKSDQNPPRNRTTLFIRSATTSDPTADNQAVSAPPPVVSQSSTVQIQVKSAKRSRSATRAPDKQTPQAREERRFQRQNSLNRAKPQRGQQPTYVHPPELPILVTKTTMETNAAKSNQAILDSSTGQSVDVKNPTAASASSTTTMTPDTTNEKPMPAESTAEKAKKIGNESADGLPPIPPGRRSIQSETSSIDGEEDEMEKPPKRKPGSYEEQVLEHVRTCMNISKALVSPANKSSRGQRMFCRRRERSSDWVHRSNDGETESETEPSNLVAEADNEANLTKIIHSPGGELQDISSLTKQFGDLVNNLANVDHQQQLANALKMGIQNANVDEQAVSVPNKGVELFVRRREEADRYIVDETNAQRPPPPPKLLQQQREQERRIMQEQAEQQQQQSIGNATRQNGVLPPTSSNSNALTRKAIQEQQDAIVEQWRNSGNLKILKSPWEAALEDPKGNPDSAFQDIFKRSQAAKNADCGNYNPQMSKSFCSGSRPVTDDWQISSVNMPTVPSSTATGRYPTQPIETPKPAPTETLQNQSRIIYAATPSVSNGHSYQTQLALDTSDQHQSFGPPQSAFAIHNGNQINHLFTNEYEVPTYHAAAEWFTTEPQDKPPNESLGSADYYQHERAEILRIPTSTPGMHDFVSQSSGTPNTVAGNDHKYSKQANGITAPQFESVSLEPSRRIADEAMNGGQMLTLKHLPQAQANGHSNMVPQPAPNPHTAEQMQRQTYLQAIRSINPTPTGFNADKYFSTVTPKPFTASFRHGCSTVDLSSSVENEQRQQVKRSAAQTPSFGSSFRDFVGFSPAPRPISRPFTPYDYRGPASNFEADKLPNAYSSAEAEPPFQSKGWRTSNDRMSQSAYYGYDGLNDEQPQDLGNGNANSYDYGILTTMNPNDARQSTKRPTDDRPRNFNDFGDDSNAAANGSTAPPWSQQTQTNTLPRDWRSFSSNYNSRQYYE